MNTKIILNSLIIVYKHCYCLYLIILVKITGSLRMFLLFTFPTEAYFKGSIGLMPSIFDVNEIFYFIIINVFRL